MHPIKFAGCNVVYGDGQSEYSALLAMKMEDGHIITCWELTDEEAERLAKNKKIYIQVLTFNKPLQPLLPGVDLEDGLSIGE